MVVLLMLCRTAAVAAAAAGWCEASILYLQLLVQRPVSLQPQLRAAVLMPDELRPPGRVQRQATQPLAHTVPQQLGLNQPLHRRVPLQGRASGLTLRIPLLLLANDWTYLPHMFRVSPGFFYLSRQVHTRLDGFVSVAGKLTPVRLVPIVTLVSQHLQSRTSLPDLLL